VATTILGAAAWGVLARQEADRHEPPAASPASQPSPAAPTVQPLGLPAAPPSSPGNPSRLEGRWVGDGDAGHLFLDVHNAYLDLWQGVGQQQDAPTTRRFITVVGNRFDVRSPLEPREVATYRWRIVGERLRFELRESTPRALTLLDGVPFTRVRE
jgi:hypothetical protein